MSRFPARLLAPALLVLAACGSDPVAAPRPTTLRGGSAVDQTGTVGTAVATAPAVTLLDEKGSPIAGVAVQFAVVSGGGSLGRTAATTDAAGTASAGSWTLGTAAGANVVEATAAGLPTVRFTATGTPAAPAAITVVAGAGQSAPVGAAVATAPAVAVRDPYGNGVPNTAVTFAVASGSGTVTGATATTGADGVARLGGWTLGIAAGAQALRATAGALSTTIAATATVPTGCSVVNYALGATLPLTWDADDCRRAPTNRRYDRLQFTTTQQEIVDAAVTGPAGRQLLLRNVATGHYVGLQPDPAFSPTAQNPMRLRYVLAPGTWALEPVAPDTAATGGYSLTTSSLGAVTDCDYIIFASTNVQFDGTVNSRSCASPFGGVEQWINLQLKTGTKVRITLSNTDFVPILVFRDDRLGPASPTLASRVGTAPGQTLVIEWTATFDTWHEIIVAPRTATLGRFTLKIEELP